MTDELKRLTDWRTRVAAFLDGLSPKDVGTVKIKTKTGKEFEMGPCLFKPGAESVSIGFGVAYSEPTVTVTPGGGYMVKVCLGGPDQDRFAWGLGYGDAAMDGDGNTALKLAFKRARVDAALSFLGASDRLTQDLDDAAYRRKMSGQSGRPSAPAAPPARAKGETRTPTEETGVEWPFGKEKGTDICHISTKSLNWYIEEYEPSKRDSKYAEKNAQMAKAVKEVLRKRSLAEAKPTPAAAPPPEEGPPMEDTTDHGSSEPNWDELPF